VSIDPSLLATMSEEEIARTLNLDGKTIADVAKTFAQNPCSTIEPPMSSRTDTPGRRAVEGLDGVHRTIVAGLALEKTIGEGGMGIVRLATQRSLGRKVAVKTLRPEARSEAATLRLLREAWVTGSLEHPNIVPVYDLGIDDDGSPIIVLKKIEGTEWATILRDEKISTEDRIEQGLRVLVLLCNAVSLAHARGILHRDLKPENVMIGSFGEVYLVDWGIAVTTRDDPTGRFPSAADAKDIAGTPAYMAPEMLGAIGKLSDRTDVYLLGAILHEILTGLPPHKGTFTQIVGSILLSEPKYGDGVPKELAAIARKAMARAPDARFESADELRQRLEWYLRHRGSLALSNEAEKSLREMRELSSHGEVDDAMRDRFYHLFAEARFGFRQAIAASKDNEEARRGLRAAIETVVAFELASGTAEAASAAMAELDDPPPSLASRVVAAAAASKKKRAELERIQADHDPQTGRKTRLAVGMMAGMFWTIAPLAAPWFERKIDIHSPYALRYMFAWSVILAGVGIALGAWGRESLSKTIHNRRMRSIMLANFAAQLLLELACYLVGVPWEQTMALHFVVWTFSVSVMAIVIEPRMWPSAGVYVASLVVVSRYPSIFWYVCAASQLALVVNIFFAWASPQDTRPSREIMQRVRQYSEKRAAHARDEDVRG
jgi:serine/threonine-protein kinase